MPGPAPKARERAPGVLGVIALQPIAGPGRRWRPRGWTAVPCRSSPPERGLSVNAPGWFDVTPTWRRGALFAGQGPQTRRRARTLSKTLRRGSGRGVRRGEAVLARG